MPKQDGTGPVGRGPMTGRGRGKCIVPLNTTEEEFKYLKNQERSLEEQLEYVKSRLKALK